VTATFSEAMNPATINATTFTLIGPGTTPVAGVNGPGVHYAYHRRDPERQSAGSDGRCLIGQRSGECTSLSMRYSVVRLV
jgi:hypothetical protein